MTIPDIDGAGPRTYGDLPPSPKGGVKKPPRQTANVTVRWTCPDCGYRSLNHHPCCDHCGTSQPKQVA